MTDPGPAETGYRGDLLRYLQSGRNALVWKLEGLSEYDARRPLVPTGTNLLGLVKHMVGVEAGYLGDTFDRPFPEDLPWLSEEAEPNADFWATPAESRSELLDLYRRVWAHGDATVQALGMDAVGRVPWWPGERSRVTLHQVLVHLVAELQRHAGQADLLRELVDGSAGLRAGGTNLPDGDATWWRAYRERVEAAARAVTD